MSVLSRYLLRGSLFIMAACLTVGTSIYILSDLFDRLDDFLEAKVSAGTTLYYFVAKTPLILSQILPAVFLVAVLVQLSLLVRSRELLALRAGGVSYGRIVRFFVAYGLVWCLFQLLFSQYLGVIGERVTTRIWAEQVRNRVAERTVIKNLWFREGRNLVSMDKAYPVEEAAEGVVIYRMDPGGMALDLIIEAARADSSGPSWKLGDATVHKPGEYTRTILPTLDVEVSQKLAAFEAIEPNQKPSQLPLWQLGSVIKELERGGSNVEILRTAWHSKLSYAFSILAMALVALAVASFEKSVYTNVVVGLLATFVFYGIFVVGTSAGEKGLLPPWAGAWLGNAAMSLLAGARLAWTGLGAGLRR